MLIDTGHIVYDLNKEKAFLSDFPAPYPKTMIYLRKEYFLMNGKGNSADLVKILPDKGIVEV